MFPVFLLTVITSALPSTAVLIPARGVSEPEKDKVMRGSRDGFVETLVFNTALYPSQDPGPEADHGDPYYRRKLPHRYCHVLYGRWADKKLIETIKKRIQNVEVDALSMNQESLAECIFPGKWFNPFPKFKFSNVLIPLQLLF